MKRKTITRSHGGMLDGDRARAWNRLKKLDHPGGVCRTGNKKIARRDWAGARKQGGGGKGQSGLLRAQV